MWQACIFLSNRLNRRRIVLMLLLLKDNIMVLYISTGFGLQKGKVIMDALIWEKPEEIDKKLAQRVSMVRQRKYITQEELSGLCDVSYNSIRRFESSGKISLLSLTKIAMALGCTDELRNIFTKIPYWDMQEVIDNNNIEN